MEAWLAYVVVAFLLFGLGGFLSKLALRTLPAESVLAHQIAGHVLGGLAALAFLGTRVDFHPEGSALAVLMGAVTILAGLFYLLSLSLGKVSVVATISALYPMVTIFLAALFLKEPVTLRQGAGIVLALASMVLMSS